MSLTLRLTITYLLITLAGVLLLGAGFVALAGRYLASQREQELSAQVELYAALLGELAATPDALQALAPTRPGAELLPADTAARLFSTAGAILAGDPALGPFPSRAALPLLSPALPLPASQVAGRAYAARPIIAPAGTIGVIELSRDTADDTRLLTGLRRLAIQAALVAAALVAVVSLLVARSIARPVVRLAARTEALAATFDDGRPTTDDGRRTTDDGRPTTDDRRPTTVHRRPTTVHRPPSTVHRPPSTVHRLWSRLGHDELATLARRIDDLEAALQTRIARIGELEQARAQFFRSVSHELRTPLTAIRAGLENLSDAAPAAQRPALDTLEGEAARLSRLVDELLTPGADTGRFTLLARAPVDLGALAAQVCALLAGRADRAGVALRAEGGALLALGDADRLKQALLNLADNALRATPPGGAVLVAAQQAGATAQLVVEDNGPGVPPDSRARIWERGVRGASPETAGSAGLGLAIVREIAAAHSGRAYLDEGYGPGARFVIELPLAEPVRARHAAPHPQ